MFGMGFSEILIIAVIAIIFLGPDKLPSAMIEIAKFFKNTKETISSVKDSIEEEIHIKDMKEEALAYKKELLGASNKLKKVTNSSQISSKLTKIGDDILHDSKDEKIIFEKKESPNA
ncbi:MAG: Sec-independent protein translocase protein TatB [Sulfurimonas sp.]|nr:Sec-independent protein translocase protein TatB [Sulfurimonas sp.]